MHPTYQHIHLFYLIIAILLEVIANVLLKLSSGLKHKIYALTAIVSVLGAFTALSFAVEGIHLSVAYAIWGGFGLIASALLGAVLFNEHLRPTGWLGMGSIMIGMALMKLA